MRLYEFTTFREKPRRDGGAGDDKIIVTGLRRKKKKKHRRDEVPAAWRQTRITIVSRVVATYCKWYYRHTLLFSTTTEYRNTTYRRDPVRCSVSVSDIWSNRNSDTLDVCT